MGVAAPITSVAFCPGTHYFFSVSKDTTIKYWAQGGTWVLLFWAFVVCYYFPFLAFPFYSSYSSFVSCPSLERLAGEKEWCMCNMTRQRAGRRGPRMPFSLPPPPAWDADHFTLVQIIRSHIEVCAFTDCWDALPAMPQVLATVTFIRPQLSEQLRNSRGRCSLFGSLGSSRCFGASEILRIVWILGIVRIFRTPSGGKKMHSDSNNCREPEDVGVGRGRA